MPKIVCSKFNRLRIVTFMKQRNDGKNDATAFNEQRPIETANFYEFITGWG